MWYAHRQLVLHTPAPLGGLASGGDHARLHRDDICIPPTPMFHMHAWGLPFVATLLGVRQVYPGRYEPEKLLRLIEREGATFSHCVPTILHCGHTFSRGLACIFHQALARGGIAHELAQPLRAEQ